LTPDDLTTHTSPQVIEYLKEFEARFAPIEADFLKFKKEEEDREARLASIEKPKEQEQQQVFEVHPHQEGV
jgi:hypothetical protein